MATAGVISLHVDVASRTIEGVAVPYGRVARTRSRRYRFAPGALRYDDVGDVRLLREHDRSLRLGRMVEHEERPVGALTRYLVDRGRRGDEALALALAGRLGLSVGVDFDAPTDTVPDPQHTGVTFVLRAFWRETSLTQWPAFHDTAGLMPALEGLAR